MNWLVILMMLALFGLLMAGLAAYRRLAHPDPEWLRKLVHMSMGVVTLSFPWLFTEVWPVLVLAGAFFVVLLSLRVLAPLRARYGGVIGGVARQSHGELCFPLAVGLLFYFSGGHPLFFCVPMLILTFADALSALIGSRYGRLRYATDDGQKSVEGSLTFFLVAFLSTLVPLNLFTRVDHMQISLIALGIGLLSMMIEASAWRGLDNLFIPLAVLVMLQSYLKLTPAQMAVQLGLVVVLFVFMLIWRGRTTLKDSAVLGAALGFYLFWAVGGWRWLLPPLILVLSYWCFAPRYQRNAERVHDNHVVISVSAVGLAWMFLAKALDRPDFFFPFTLAFAVHLAIIGVIRWRRSAPGLPAAVPITTCVAVSWLLLFGPYVLVEQWSRTAFHAAAVAPAGIALGVVLFYFTQPGMDDCPNDPERWMRQSGVAALGSVLGSVPFYLI